MSDAIKHECGIALLRLLKPLDYYTKKYGTSFYGINKMYLLSDKVMIVIRNKDKTLKSKEKDISFFWIHRVQCQLAGTDSDHQYRSTHPD